MHVTSPWYSYLTSLTRQGLTLGAGVLAAHGWLTGSQGQALIAAAPLVLSVLWSLISHSNLQAAIDLARKMPAGTTRDQLADSLSH